MSTCLDCPAPVVKPKRGRTPLRCPACRRAFKRAYVQTWRADWTPAMWSAYWRQAAQRRGKRSAAYNHQQYLQRKRRLLRKLMGAP